jgi:hypothetical protein
MASYTGQSTVTLLLPKSKVKPFGLQQAINRQSLFLDTLDNNGASPFSFPVARVSVLRSIQLI